MKLAVLESVRGRSEVEEVADPVFRRGRGPGPGRGACGVCASELDMWDGRGAAPFPLYPGHEVSGTVVEAGAEVAADRPGRPGRGLGDQPRLRRVRRREGGVLPVRGRGAARTPRWPSRWPVRPTRWSWPTYVSATTSSSSARASWATWCSSSSRCAARGRSIVADTRPDALERRPDWGRPGPSTSAAESLADVVVGADRSARRRRQLRGAPAPRRPLADGRRRHPDERQGGAGRASTRGRPGRSRWASGTGWRSTSSTRTSGTCPRSCAA